MTNTETTITLANGTEIDLSDRDTWTDDFDPQALYDEAGTAGDSTLCRTLERLGLAR